MTDPEREESHDFSRVEDVKLIEHCLRNTDAEARELLDRHPVSDRAVPCLQRCGDCRERPILVADGDLYAGRSHVELLERALDDKGGDER